MRSLPSAECRLPHDPLRGHTKHSNLPPGTDTPLHGREQALDEHLSQPRRHQAFEGRWLSRPQPRRKPSYRARARFTARSESFPELFSFFLLLLFFFFLHVNVSTHACADHFQACFVAGVDAHDHTMNGTPIPLPVGLPSPVQYQTR